MEFTRHFVHQLWRSLDKVRVVGRGSEGEREPFEPARTGEGRSLLLLFSAYLSPYPTPPLFSRNLCFFVFCFLGFG